MHVCLVPMKARECQILGLNLKIAVSCYAGPGNQTRILWKNSLTFKHLCLCPALFPSPITPWFLSPRVVAPDLPTASSVSGLDC